MRSDSLLVFNAGSSTLKLGMFQIDGTEAVAVGNGHIDLRAEPLVFTITYGSAISNFDLKARVTDDLHDVIDELLNILASHFEMHEVKTVSHRVVHGGERFLKAIRLDKDVIAEIEALTPLAPLHQPAALRFIRAMSHLRPELPQTASFDTAFHASQTDLVRRYAIPRALHSDGVKKYGFHGLSYQYVAASLARHCVWAGRTVIAHLGSGASVCGLHNRMSVDCSMGFSTLDGVPMATRPGALDPGVMLYLMREGRMSHDDLEDMLYHRSGLLGVSGISADTRQLLIDQSDEAKQAIDLFCLRIAGEIARICATLGGLDTLVFTAGIGEHQPGIRTKIAARLSWMGVEIDEYQNARDAEAIGTKKSKVRTFVIPTHEEQVIADEALALVEPSARGGGERIIIPGTR